MTVDADSLHRTAKIFSDSGEAPSLDAGMAILRDYVLQLNVGPEVADNNTMQAAVVTAVNAGGRAFLGGVRVKVDADPTVRYAWFTGRRLSEAVVSLGGTIVADLAHEHPTICIGSAAVGVVGNPVLRATFDGWAAGVTEGTATPLAERDVFVPAGVATAGIAVAEAFQHRRGDIRAGRRAQGISLWNPGLDWRDDAAAGPDDVRIAPSRWWVIGLGHLGQAYLWTIGLLPYVDPSGIVIMLQDEDRITQANESTGLLTTRATRGERKTRVLAAALEDRGFSTAITERWFRVGHGPVGDEPRLALIGVDNPETRAHLSDSGFDVVFEAGLGGGPVHYLDLHTHVFPSDRRSETVPGWQGARAMDDGLLDLPAYASLAASPDDQCGVVQIAGRSVAAAFVGATASALVIAEATRFILGETPFAVVDATLRDLSATSAVRATGAPPAGNPGFAALA